MRGSTNQSTDTVRGLLDLIRQVASFLPRRPGFDLGVAHARFVSLDRAALGSDSPRPPQRVNISQCSITIHSPSKAGKIFPLAVAVSKCAASSYTIAHF
jgi:hypothetical protein